MSWGDEVSPRELEWDPAGQDDHAEDNEILLWALGVDDLIEEYLYLIESLDFDPTAKADLEEMTLQIEHEALAGWYTPTSVILPDGAVPTEFHRVSQFRWAFVVDPSETMVLDITESPGGPGYPRWWIERPGQSAHVSGSLADALRVDGVISDSGRSTVQARPAPVLQLVDLDGVEEPASMAPVQGLLVPVRRQR